jgi:hypothetical protein
LYNTLELPSYAQNVTRTVWLNFGEKPMRLTHVILPLLLAACATPQQSCISSATRELSVINRLVQQTRANVTRGFAISERQETIVRQTTCEGETSEGVTFEFDCEETDTRTVREPQAIDLNAEKDKLASLEQRQRQLRINADAEIAQCRAQFPE